MAMIDPMMGGGLVAGAGVVAGAIGARVLDSAAPRPLYTLRLGDRSVGVTTSMLVGAVGVGLAVAGVLPAADLLAPVAVGMLAHEIAEETGDDLADLLLGPAAPAAPTLPPVAPAPVQPLGFYGAGPTMSDQMFGASLAGLQTQFG